MANHKSTTVTLLGGNYRERWDMEHIVVRALNANKPGGQFIEWVRTSNSTRTIIETWRLDNMLAMG